MTPQGVVVLRGPPGEPVALVVCVTSDHRLRYRRLVKIRKVRRPLAAG